MDLTGFVLAGGKSSRMGRDKTLLDWHGCSLLEHMLELLSKVADPVRVVGRAPLPDRLPDLGPLSGIATGLEASFTDANLFVAVDLPLLTPDFLKFLKSRIENSSQPVLACKIESGFPLCLGMWRPMLPEITARLKAGQLSVRGLLEAGATEIVSQEEIARLGFDLGMFSNINTEDDYRSALRTRL